MIIPYQQLNPQTLTALVEEFITREGTDYGAHETALETKVEQVRRQLTSGEVVIVFDPAMASTTLMPARDAQALR